MPWSSACVSTSCVHCVQVSICLWDASRCDSIYVRWPMQAMRYDAMRCNNSEVACERVFPGVNRGRLRRGLTLTGAVIRIEKLPESGNLHMPPTLESGAGRPGGRWQTQQRVEHVLQRRRAGGRAARLHYIHGRWHIYGNQQALVIPDTPHPQPHLATPCLAINPLTQTPYTIMTLFNTESWVTSPPLWIFSSVKNHKMAAHKNVT